MPAVHSREVQRFASSSRRGGSFWAQAGPTGSLVLSPIFVIRLIIGKFEDCATFR